MARVKRAITNGANLGSEEKLWAAADKLRGHMDAAEYQGARVFYTRQSDVKLLVEMIEPYKGRIYDPCCGSGCMVIRPKSPASAYFPVRPEELLQHLIANMPGTSRCQRGPVDCLNSYVLAVPDELLARAFGHIADSLLARMKSNDAESATVVARRDARLPKRLSEETLLATVPLG